MGRPGHAFWRGCAVEGELTVSAQFAVGLPASRVGRIITGAHHVGAVQARAPVTMQTLPKIKPVRRLVDAAIFASLGIGIGKKPGGGTSV